MLGALARPYGGALNALGDVVIACVCLLDMLKTSPLRKQDAEESELSPETALSMMLDSPGDPPPRGGGQRGKLVPERAPTSGQVVYSTKQTYIETDVPAVGA